MKKLLITGPYSTGKTTLAEELHATLIDEAFLIEDPSRSCTLPMNKDQNADTSYWLFGMQLARESAAKVQQDVHWIICDRGIPDIIAHTLQDVFPKQKKRNQVEAMIEFAKSWLLSYDFIFYSSIDHNISIKLDDLRIADEEYRSALDRTHRDFLQLSRVHVRELPFRLNERLTDIRKVIGARPFELTNHDV